MDNVTYKQVESETITVSNTAVGFTSDKLTSATLYVLYYELDKQWSVNL